MFQSLAPRIPKTILSFVAGGVLLGLSLPGMASPTSYGYSYRDHAVRETHDYRHRPVHGGYRLSHGYRVSLPHYSVTDLPHRRVVRSHDVHAPRHGWRHERGHRRHASRRHCDH